MLQMLMLTRERYNCFSWLVLTRCSRVSLSDLHAKTGTRSSRPEVESLSCAVSQSRYRRRVRLDIEIAAGAAQLGTLRPWLAGTWCVHSALAKGAFCDAVFFLFQETVTSYEGDKSDLSWNFHELGVMLVVHYKTVYEWMLFSETIASD